MITTKKELIEKLNKIENVDELAKVIYNSSEDLNEEFNNTLDSLEYTLDSNTEGVQMLLQTYSDKGSSSEFFVDVMELKDILSNFNAKYDYVFFNNDVVYMKDTLNYDKNDNFKDMVDEVIEELTFEE